MNGERLVPNPARWIQRLYERVGRGLGRVHPARSLAFARAAALVAHGVKLWGPTKQETASLFGPSEARRLRRISRAICQHDFTNHTLWDLALRGGLEAVAPAFVPSGLERLGELVSRGQPALVLGWHTGFALTLQACLAQTGWPVLVLRSGQDYRHPPWLEICHTHGGLRARAYAFKRALERLQAGGLVVVGGDIGPGRSIELDVLGRRLNAPRGPYALARLSGAPLLPLSSRWQAGRVHVEVHRPLALPDAGPLDETAFEEGLAREAARWFDGRLRSGAEVLQRVLLRQLLGAPAAPVPEALSAAAAGLA